MYKRISDYGVIGDLRTVALVGEFSRRYDPNKYEYYGVTYKTNYQYVAKKYGASLTALAWVTYIFPNYSDMK